MGQLLLIAARSLFRHGRRSLMLGGAILLVTALLILLQGLGDGIRETMLRNATTLLTGHVNVGGFYKVSAGQGAPLVTRYHEIEALVRETVPELDHLVARRRGWGKLISEQGSMQVGFNGIDIRNEPDFRRAIQLVEGNLDGLVEPDTALLFEDHAQKLEVGVGDMLTVSSSTARGVANTADLRVIGIARNIGIMSRLTIFVSDATLRSLYQLNEDTTGAVMLYLRDMETIPQVVARLRSALEARGFALMEADSRPFFMKVASIRREDWVGQRLDVTTWEDEISFFNYTLRALEAVTSVLVGILLVIIVIGIMNTLWIAIRERTREIGTLRAIGMQRSSVLWMFLLEAMLLGLLGTAAGALIGVAASAGLNAARIEVPLAVRIFLMSDRLELSVGFSSVFLAVGVISSVTTLAALYPSYRATRLKPVTAMHHVG